MVACDRLPTNADLRAAIDARWPDAFALDEQPPFVICEAGREGYTRYVRFWAPTDELPQDLRASFSLLWGRYSQGALPDDFDARSMGDLGYCLRFIEAWLIDGVAWQQVPRSPLAGG